MDMYTVYIMLIDPTSPPLQQFFLYKFDLDHNPYITQIHCSKRIFDLL